MHTVCGKQVPGFPFAPAFFHRRDDKPFAFAGVYDIVPGKKDELGLTGRKAGQAYSTEQRERILGTVQVLKSEGVPAVLALRELTVPRSTFYSWRSEKAHRPRPNSSNALFENETRSVISMKVTQP